MKFIPSGISIDDKRWPAVFSLTAVIMSATHAVLIGYARGVGTDGALYALSGYNLFEGYGYTYSDVPNTFLSPLFPILIGLCNFVTSDLQISAHIVLTISFAAGVWPIYHSIIGLFGKKAAFLAAMFYSLNGFLIRMSTHILPEVLAISLLLWAAYFISRLTTAFSLKHAILAGTFFGLAYLAKPESLLYAIFMIGSLILLALVHRERLYAASAIFVAILCFLVMLPFLFFLKQQTSQWQVTTYNRYLFRNIVQPLVRFGPDSVRNDRIDYNYNAYVVRGDYDDDQRTRDLKQLPVQLRDYAKSLLTVVGPFHLLLLGGLFILKDRDRRRWLLAGILPVLFIFLWYTIRDRLFIMGLPFFIMVSSVVIADLFERRVPFGTNIGLTFLIILVIGQSYTPFLNHAPANRVTEHTRALGEWVRDQLKEAKNTLIADRKPDVAFFAKARFYRYNNVHGYDALIGELKDHRVQYLVVDDLWTTMKNPGVRELLKGEPTPDLIPIHQIDHPSYGKAILYQLR